MKQRIFKECPYPDNDQRHQLGEELRLEPKQIKFWFQNKRTQLKTLRERSDNIALQFGKENKQSENAVNFSSCRGPNSREGERAPTLKNLRLENELLHQEHERLLEHVRQENGINTVFPPTLQYSYDPLQGTSLNQKSEVSSAPCPHIPSFGNHYHITPTHALHQDIPALNPSLDQNFSALTPTPYQNVSAHTCPTTATIHQKICVMTPSPNQNFLDLAHGCNISLDQNFSTTTTTQAFDQSIPPFTYSDHDQEDIWMDISNNDQDIDFVDNDQDIDVLEQNFHDLMSNFFQDFGAALAVQDGGMLPHPMSTTMNTEKEVMFVFANNATEELTTLLSMNEPYWVRSIDDGKYILHRETYDKLYPKSNCVRGPHARIESSKDSRVVSMSGRQLVDMFLNSDKWANLFPTIVKNAQTIQVFDIGSLGTRDGTLQLMNAKMHILSPMIPIRELVFLRCCKQIEVGVWVIADVSLDSSSTDGTPPRGLKFPSGCMIQEMTNKSCRVSWVEHVEVDERIQSDWLFRELIYHNNAYGAERWVLTLERMCERFRSSSLESLTGSDTRGVISSAKGRRSLMKLTHRMVKMFCGTLDMTDNMDFPELNKFNSGGVRISVRNNIDTSMQEGMTISAATSFWLPVSPQNVFNFLKDNSNRRQWDVLCNGSPVCEIQHISNGTDPGNFTSIIQPFNPKESDMLILQESYTHPLESLLVYAPIDIATLNFVLKGEDSSLLSLLPSGFTISRYGRENACTEQSGGSLVTLVYQVLQAHNPSKVDMLDMDFVASINKLLSKTVEKIKVALNCSSLD